MEALTKQDSDTTVTNLQSSGDELKSNNGKQPKVSKRMLKAYNLQSFTAADREATPILSLEPLNDTFSSKRIDLIETVKIGRQVSPKSPPSAENGVFDSKVLSRQHAEITYDNGKVLIKDVGSSNGTFLNGERLSAEGMPSDPKELKLGDLLEFGVDIMNDSNTAVLHKKVSCKVLFVGGPEQSVASKSDDHASHNFVLTSNASQPDSQKSVALPVKAALLDDSKNRENAGATDNDAAAIARLEDEVRKARENNQQLESLKNDLAKLGDLIELKSEVVAVSTDNSNNPAEVKSLKEEIQALKDQINTLKYEEQAFKQQSSKKEQELKQNFESQKSSLQDKITELEASLSQSQAHLKEAEAKLSENNDGLSKFDEEKKVLQEQYSSKISDLENKLSAAEADFKSQLQNANSSLSNETQKNQALSLEVESLKTKLNESESTSNRLQETEKQLVEVKGQLQEAQDKISKLSSLEEELKSSREKVQNLESSNINLSQELQNKNREYQEEISILKADVNKYAAQEAELVSLRKEVSELSAKPNSKSAETTTNDLLSKADQETNTIAKKFNESHTMTKAANEEKNAETTGANPKLNIGQTIVVAVVSFVLSFIVTTYFNDNKR